MRNIGTLGYYLKKLKKNDLTTPDNLDIFKFLNFIKKKKINRAIIEASSHGLHQGRLSWLNLIVLFLQIFHVIILIIINL